MKRLITVSVVVGAFALQGVPAYAYPTTVYTTTNDFSTGNIGTGVGWSGNDFLPSTAWDYDGSTVNGVANASPGGAGTAGSIEIVPSGAGELGWTLLGELYVGNFSTARVALDPGYTDPGAVFPAAEGTITLVYTLPDNALGGGGTYFDPMIGFNSSWTWGLSGPDSKTSLGIVNGKDTYQATFSYSIPANAGGWGVNLMVGASSDYAPIEPFYYDAIVITEAVVVPEPTMMSLIGMGALMGGFLIRRARNSR